MEQLRISLAAARVNAGLTQEDVAKNDFPTQIIIELLGRADNRRLRLIYCYVRAILGLS